MGNFFSSGTDGLDCLGSGLGHEFLLMFSVFVSRSISIARRGSLGEV